MIVTNLTLFPAGVGAIIYYHWYTLRTKTYRFHFRFMLALVAMLMAYITQIVWAHHLYPQTHSNKNILVAELFFKIEEYIWQYRVVPPLLYAWHMFDALKAVEKPQEHKWALRMRSLGVTILLLSSVVAMQLGNYYAGRMVIYKVIPFKENPTKYNFWLDKVYRNDKALALV